jgi:hypothetical protein
MNDFSFSGIGPQTRCAQHEAAVTAKQARLNQAARFA